MSAQLETTGTVPGGVRLLAVVGAGWAGLLTTVGPRVWVALTGHRPSERDRVLVRVLGARHLVQGVWQGIAPSRGRRLFLWVDLIHSASMLALAGLDRPRRRPALVSATAALASATVSTMLASPVRSSRSAS